MNAQYIDRHKVSIMVSDVIKNTGQNLKIYGSFKKGSFHLNANTWKSFSDIDLIHSHNVSDKYTELLSEDISQSLRSLLNLKFRVSIRRERIHSYHLRHDISTAVALVELIYKSKGNPTHDYQNYQYSKS